MLPSIKFALNDLKRILGRYFILLLITLIDFKITRAILSKLRCERFAYFVSLVLHIPKTPVTLHS